MTGEFGLTSLGVVDVADEGDFEARVLVEDVES